MYIFRIFLCFDILIEGILASSLNYTLFSPLFLLVPKVFSQITCAEALRIAAEKSWKNGRKTSTNT